MVTSILDFYFIAEDTSPTTSVIQTSSGTTIANNSAAYLQWLTGGNSASTFYIISAADNGAGLIRLELDTSYRLQTGMRFAVANSGVADGNWPVTVIDATHVDLQGSAFTTTFTGNLRGGQIIDTLVHVYDLINSTAETFYSAPGIPQYQQVSSAVNFQLTNPLPTLIDVSFSVTGKTLTLPAMNLVTSRPRGSVIKIWNNGSQAFTLNDVTGADFSIYNSEGSIAPGEGIDLIVLSRVVNAGAWEKRIIVPAGYRGSAVTAGLRSSAGGTGKITYTDGDTFYGQPAASGGFSVLTGNITSTKKYLSQTGSGAASAAPVWAQVAVADLSGFGANVATWLGAPSSANLAAALTDETGIGSVVFSVSPTLSTPVLGTPTSVTLTNATGLPESGLSLTDIATNNASTSKHGFAPKYPNDATKYLDGTGAYTVPAGPAASSRFSATKGGTDQGSFPDATATKITYGTEDYDIGSHFASSTWTPDAGPITISAGFIGTGSIALGADCNITIYKNGAAWRKTGGVAVTGVFFANMTVDDNANGTDTYEVYGYADFSVGTGVITGSTVNTWFTGHRWN